MTELCQLSYLDMFSLFLLTEIVICDRIYEKGACHSEIYSEIQPVIAHVSILGKIFHSKHLSSVKIWCPESTSNQSNSLFKKAHSR